MLLSGFHQCPECEIGYRCSEKKLHNGIYLYTYTCKTELHLIRNGNKYTYKWKFCKERMNEKTISSVRASETYSK